MSVVTYATVEELRRATFEVFNSKSGGTLSGGDTVPFGIDTAAGMASSTMPVTAPMASDEQFKRAEAFVAEAVKDLASL